MGSDSPENHPVACGGFRRIAWIAVLLLAAIAGWHRTFPWVVRQGLKRTWANVASEPVEFTVRSARWGQLVLSDVVVGRIGDPVARAGRIEVTFNLAALRRGEVETLAVDAGWTWGGVGRREDARLALFGLFSREERRPGRSRAWSRLPFESVRLSNFEIELRPDSPGKSPWRRTVLDASVLRREDGGGRAAAVLHSSLGASISAEYEFSAASSSEGDGRLALEAVWAQDVLCSGTLRVGWSRDPSERLALAVSDGETGIPRQLLRRLLGGLEWSGDNLRLRVLSGFFMPWEGWQGEVALELEGSDQNLGEGRPSSATLIHARARCKARVDAGGVSLRDGSAELHGVVLCGAGRTVVADRAEVEFSTGNLFAEPVSLSLAGNAHFEFEQAADLVPGLVVGRKRLDTLDVAVTVERRAGAGWEVRCGVGLEPTAFAWSSGKWRVSGSQTLELHGFSDAGLFSLLCRSVFRDMVVSHGIPGGEDAPVAHLPESHVLLEASGPAVSGPVATTLDAHARGCTVLGLEAVEFKLANVVWSNAIPVGAEMRIAVGGSEALPAMSLRGFLGARRDGWEATVEVPLFGVTNEDPLGRLAMSHLPLPGLSLSGQVGGSVLIRARAGSPPNTTVQLCASNLLAKAEGWQVEQLAGSAELFLRQNRLRTTGEQTLSFGRSRIGGMEFDGGRARWQLDGDTLRVANAELDWLDGHLRAHALDVDVKKRDASFVLYVDEVDVGCLLRLVKPLAGSGEGRLFGRFPVRLEKGRWRITTAYLYSMPGQEGSIRLSDTRTLVALLAQTGVSREVRDTLADALRDFRFTTFALELHPPEEEGGEMLLAIRLLGVSRDLRRPTPVNATLNLRGPLETLLNMGVVLGRMQE